jgi:hypothetical protein
MLELGILIPPAALDADWPFHVTTEPGRPKSNLAATDSGGGTWSGKLSVNGELTVTNLIPHCQPGYALWEGYQGRVICVAQTAKLPW